MNSDTQIETFATAATVDECARAINSLIKQKKLHSAAKSPAFQAGLQKLAAFASGNNSERDRLLAVAILARIGRIVKPVHKQMNQLLSKAFAEPLPPLDLLDDPDDRFAVISAWRFAPAEWWAAYLATAAVEQENTAERMRSESIQGLLALASDLVSAIGQLRAALLRLRFDTADPATSTGRRLHRILSTLRTFYSQEPIEPGQNAGVVFAKWVNETFRSVGPPTDSETRTEVAEEAARIVHELVRARFSLATSPSTYAVIDTLHSWYKPYEWASLAEKSPALSLLRADISEALRLLIQAGITDDRLFEKLVQTVESSKKAREIARKLAEEAPGLPEPVRRWLLGSTPLKESPLATESQQRSVDEIVADLLIDTLRLSEMAEAAEREILPEMAVVAPRLADPLAAFVRQCQRTLNDLKYVAEKRSLRVRGNTGEEVDFSPLEHEMLGGSQPGVRRVRIVRPVVEAASADGVARIVRKGLVEPATVNHS